MNRPAVIISADVLSWFKFSVVKKENWQMQISKQQRDALLRESNTLLREIHALYSGFDRRFHLRGAEVPVTFGFDTDQLGSYTQGKDYSEEEFHFSLLFIGRSLPHPLSKEDRIDLYKHEYAHYMQYNMPIEQKYQWQYGTHGSAWKYCCSLIGAAPTPLYRAGEGSMEHDYEKALKKPVSDHCLRLRPDALALEGIKLRHALLERLALIGRIHPLLCKRIIADIYRSCVLFPPFRETVVDVFGYRFRV